MICVAESEDGKSKKEVERIKLVMEIIRNEYDAEHERAGAFEGRTGVLITLAGAILVFVGQSFSLPKGNVYFVFIIFLQML